MTMNLLQMSFYGAVLILVITAVRALAINRLPKKTFLILWGIVMLRLLIPYSVPSALSVYSWISSNMPEAVIEESETHYDHYAPVSPTVSSEPTEKLTPSEPSEPKAQIPPLSSENNGFNTVLPVTWLSGTVLLAVFFTAAYLRCYFEFKTSLPVENEFTRQWLIEQKIKRPLSIRQSDKITAPLTYGILRPVILMPKQTDWNNTKQLRYVLLHEYVHICRFDAFLKLICVFVLCLHWFNPTVWLMYILFNRDIELVCDECTVKNLGISNKADYALTLIGMEEKKAGLTRLYSGFGNNSIKERIVSVMKIKKISAPAVAVSVILTVGVTAAFATSAEYEEIYTDESVREAAVSENIADPTMYEVYRPFGLTVNPADSKLYYGGKLVRCFDDQISAGFFGIKAIGYYEKNGVIDVRAVRENSELTGLEVLSEEDFNSKTIKEDVPSRDTANSTSIFDIYLEYGLEYDKAQNVLYYGDDRVRLFWDCLSSDSKPSASESPFISTVSNWDEKGTVDLYVVRDYRQKDKNGYGKIIGLRIADQQEFENNTSIFADRNNAAEYGNGNIAVTVSENLVGFEGMDEREIYGEIYGGEIVDSFPFFGVKSGQYALSEAVYEIKDTALFNYAVNWEPMGNYIQVGLISTDKSRVYSDSCISGRASGNIEIPSGSYYVMVYNEPSSDIDLNATVAYTFNK